MASKGFPEIGRRVEVNWPELGWIPGLVSGHLSSQWEWVTNDERLPPWDIIMTKEVEWRYIK